MNVRQLQSSLEQQPNTAVHLMLPDGSFVPAHFHVTEVGRVQKDFIDCGGTTRSTLTCQIQLWIADDIEHRLDSTKFAKILAMAQRLLGSDELPVEMEYEGTTISQYPLTEIEVTPAGLLLQLGTKHTDCLARDKCGVSLGTTEECCAPGCC